MVAGKKGIAVELSKIIANCIGRVVSAEGTDNFVAISDCDKIMRGSTIAIAPLNHPTVFVYGGTILPGCLTMNSPAPMN